MMVNTTVNHNYTLTNTLTNTQPLFRRHIDIARLTRIVNGFSTFTVAGLTSAEDQRMLDTTSKDALRVLFSTRGSYVQSLLVEELVSAVDVLSREALSEVTRRVMGSVAAATERRAREALGPLRPLVIPLPTPFEVLSRCVGGGGGGGGGFTFGCV